MLKALNPKQTFPTKIAMSSAGFLCTILVCLDDSVGDAEPNTVSLRRVIPVLDVNDNPPQFHGRPYAFSVPESAKVCLTLKH